MSIRPIRSVGYSLTDGFSVRSPAPSTRSATEPPRGRHDAADTVWLRGLRWYSASRASAQLVFGRPGMTFNGSLRESAPPGRPLPPPSIRGPPRGRLRSACGRVAPRASASARRSSGQWVRPARSAAISPIALLQPHDSRGTNIVGAFVRAVLDVEAGQLVEQEAAQPGGPSCRSQGARSTAPA